MSSAANSFIRVGGPARGQPILEREHEKLVLAQGVEQARHGNGSVILVEAPAGKGKSALLAIAADLATRAGLRVAAARATELEREFPFGVVIQLFEPHWMSAGAKEREHLVGGPARWAGELLDAGLRAMGSTSGEHAFAMIHSLFWFAWNLARPSWQGSVTRPMAIVVDDLHLADAPSLRFLSYLAARVADMPILLVTAGREGSSPSDPTALAALREAASGAMLRPALLSESAVTAIVRRALPASDDSFCCACARLTGGNPFLLNELVDHVRADEVTPDAVTAVRLGTLTPESVVDAIVARLGALSRDALAVASAVAILGDGASLQQVALLARLKPEATSRAADALAGAHVLLPDAPLAVRHPMIASAILASISPLDRAQAHSRAAEILDSAGAGAEHTATQLLAAAPASNPRAVEVLRTAARTALSRGAAETAVRTLERALAEPPPDELRVDILGELGEAEVFAGRPGAVERLEQAIKATVDPGRRMQLVLTQAEALHARGAYRQATEALDSARQTLPGRDDRLAGDLEAAYIASASYLPEFASQIPRLREELLSRSGERPTRVQRRALAQLARRAALSGDARQSVTELVNRTWGIDDSSLGDNRPSAPTWRLLMDSLLVVDELELNLELCQQALAVARDAGLPEAYAAASYGRAWSHFARGLLLEAMADAEAVIGASPPEGGMYVRGAQAVIACCHLQRERLDLAEGVLASIGFTTAPGRMGRAFLLDIRAQLRLAQHRPAEALADALEAGRLLQSELAARSPGAAAWRSTAALAHLAQGSAETAQQLAAEELELAIRGDVRRVILRDLRVLGLAERGAHGIELLEEAVRLGERQPPRLEYVQALVDLGAARRRANRRADAREPLHRAIELSQRGGITGLENRARAELVATGARPRKQMRTGLDALTPSELRVGEVAAQGLSTRQIAEALFITPKTVEFHLGNIYRKLDIRSRTKLAEALDGELATRSAS